MDSCYPGISDINFSFTSNNKKKNLAKPDESEQ